MRGQRLRVPGCNGAGTAERSYPASKVGAAGRSHLAPDARGSDPEEPPRARGLGLQLGEATHAGGREDNPRSGGCTGTGGPRGAISH